MFDWHVLELQGLVDAYVANSQQGKAVDYLNSLRDKLVAAAATAASSSSSAATSSSENTAATAAVMPGSSDEAAADAASSSGVAEGAAGDASSDASTSDRVPVDPVGVQLLLGELLVLCIMWFHMYLCANCSFRAVHDAHALHKQTPQS